MSADVVFTTPEKLDVISRLWTSYKEFYSNLGLVMIDEVHLLSETKRGATLEAVVSRLGYVKSQVSAQNGSLRFVAVSATAPNLEDIAKWLGAPIPQGVLSFGPEFRPCPLDIVVRGFGYAQHSTQNEFLFDRSLNNSVLNVLNQYSDQQPSLVFCTSRKNARELAEKLSASRYGLMWTQGAYRQRSEMASGILDNEPLRCCIEQNAIGWHTAAIDSNNLRIVEEIFRAGLLSVLACTTTLAQGVNLPAHLVVIKNTKAYRGSGRGMENIPITTILQMTGRAGRPGFDTNGIAVIMTRKGDERRFQNLLAGLEPIESQLEKDMQEILVNEIVVGSIQTNPDAISWVESTFRFQAAKTHSETQRLKMIVVRNIQAIQDAKCAKISPDHTKIVPTELGEIVCRHYLRLNTALSFLPDFALPEEATYPLYPDDGNCIKHVLGVLSRAQEFEDLVLRRDQKSWLNEINWVSGRFRNKKNKCRVASIPDKIFQLLQAILGQIQPVAGGVLLFEIGTVRSEAIRICKAYLMFLKGSRKSAMAVHAQVLLRSLETKTWCEEGSILQLKQIGKKLYGKLVELGIFTVFDLIQAVRTSRETMEKELGKNRFKRVITQASQIAGNTVTIQLRWSLGDDSVEITLNNEEGVGMSTGFEVFLCCTNELLDTFYLRPNQVEKRKIENLAEHAEVVVYAIHPKYHGLDVFESFDLTENPPKKRQSSPDLSRAPAKFRVTVPMKRKVKEGSKDIRAFAMLAPRAAPVEGPQTVKPAKRQATVHDGRQGTQRGTQSKKATLKAIQSKRAQFVKPRPVLPASTPTTTILVPETPPAMSRASNDRKISTKVPREMPNPSMVEKIASGVPGLSIRKTWASSTSNPAVKLAKTTQITSQHQPRPSMISQDSSDTMANSRCPEASKFASSEVLLLQTPRRSNSPVVAREPTTSIMGPSSVSAASASSEPVARPLEFDEVFFL
eukprot:CAMPEP_0203743982 /NCGR_PEP_ID=MMETSP0098-20131031/209_1 /ASSEMBLY_ACC=CAM_ASM_000208 /TAXON_ID=96639 /ORGANISM=" , Strain NY0313808BC1" /LENGTH=960 /DNA_ID=CAMNT_0050631377 /DNA_START=223 /DNA_END=3105 /DNA_ORIENTATION=+